MTPKGLALLLLTLALHSSIAQSEISFEWVTVGDPGNPNDPLTGAPTDYGPLPVRGAVPHVYSISKYETTIGQYTAFLNAVAKSDPRGLYDSTLSSRDAVRGITMVGAPGSYTFHVRNGISGLSSANLPVTYISYLGAVRFVNWLHNGQGSGDTETGAYTISNGQITRASRSGGVVTLTTAEPHSLNVGDWVQLSSNGSFYYGSAIVTARTDTTFSYFSGVGGDLPEQELPGSMIGISARKSDARYWVPSENEWYKAAYYDPSPTGPDDDYWRYPYGSDERYSGRGNYYAVRYYTTKQMHFEMEGATYIIDVRGGFESPSGTMNQAGNVEEWTEGDSFSGGPHTRGGWWDKSYSDPNVPQLHPFWRMASFVITVGNNTAPLPSGDGIGFRVATTVDPPGGGLRNGDSIRFHPRIGHGARMLGGVFEGSIDGTSYTPLHTITQAPPNGWTEVSVNFDTARYFRYRGPENSFGNVAEIEFHRSGAKVTAAASGTSGSWGNQGNTFDKALDGDINTFFDAPEPLGAYVQLDSGLGTPRGTRPGGDRLMITNGISGDYLPDERVPVNAPLMLGGQQFVGWDGFTTILDDPKSPNAIATIPGWGINLWLTAIYKLPAPDTFVLQVADGSGDGWYPTGTSVTVSANPPRVGQRFAGWTGDIAILSNPFLAITSALVPAMNVSIAATYSAVDTIRFYPRLYHAARMVGGVFEGTNGDRDTGPYETLYTISSEPPLAWNEVQVDLKNYRCLRYRGPEDSFCNVAEIEFYRNGAGLVGLVFGTPGSWYDLGNTFDRATDNTPDTFFDAPIATGAYVGVDTKTFNARIRFHPRLDHTARMIGGVFEGTNGDPVNGPYETIYTISSEPLLAWNEVMVDLKDYRHLRYRGPANSFGNIAEMEFYRYGGRLNGTAFGTPGSWYDLGNTFDKALDGNLDTFFDAPIATGAYVGITVLGTPNGKIRFYPRLYHTARMVGGVFEGTNGDPVNGPYVTIYTVSSEPPLAWNEVVVDLKDYRYLRYRGPEDSWGNVAEIEFYRSGVKVSGGPFGTPGSWYDLGNTFDKALDGNLETFFDAPIPTGAYVGIDSP